MGECERKLRNAKFANINLETRIERWLGLIILLINAIVFRNIIVFFVGFYLMFIGTFGPKLMLLVARDLDKWEKFWNMIP